MLCFISIIMKLLCFITFVGRNMAEKYYFVNNQWLTYAEAHALGYTQRKPNIYTCYTLSLTPVTIRQDVSDNTFYDSSHLTGRSDIQPWWPSDQSDREIYNKLTSSITIYRGEEPVQCNGSFSSSMFTRTPSHVNMNNSIVSLADLYRHQGITQYKCRNIYVEYGNALIWYDEQTQLYWDNQEGRKCWQPDMPSLRSTEMYDSQERTRKSIVDREDLEQIIMDDGTGTSVVISYSDFYSNPYYGVIRDTVLVFKPSVSTTYMDCFYDSYSDKYCIPQVTNTWISKSDIIAIGWKFVNGKETLYLCDNELSLVYDTNMDD